MPAIEGYDLENMWFQKDRAPCRTTRANMASLQEIFPGLPPRSCNWTPFDLFLWDYAKYRVYADKPLTLELLRTNIRPVVAGILPNMCQKVVEIAEEIFFVFCFYI